MKQIDSMTLMAYADGELAAPEQAEVEQAIGTDPQLREQLQQLQQLDSLVGAAFNQPLNERQPSLRALDTRLSSDSTEQPRTDALNNDQLRSKLWFGSLERFAPQLGAAALLVMMLGVGAGSWYQKQSAQQQLLSQQQRIEQAINQALESHLSGDPLQWSSEQASQQGTITPVRTYRNDQGQFCREFIDQRQQAGQVSEQRGVACRDQQGWSVKASYFL